jgi:hypothetical protein
MSFGVSLSAAATPICRQILLPAPTAAQIDASFNELAELKLQIDLAKAKGNNSPAQSNLTKDYFKKKNEILEILNLTDESLKEQISEKIANIQFRENEALKKEGDARKQERVDLKLNLNADTKWNLNSTLKAIPNNQFISEKYGLIIEPFGKPIVRNLKSRETLNIDMYRLESFTGDPHSDIVTFSGKRKEGDSDEYYFMDLKSLKIEPIEVLCPDLKKWADSFDIHRIEINTSPDNKYLSAVITPSDQSAFANTLQYVIIDRASKKILFQNSVVKKTHLAHYATLLSADRLVFFTLDNYLYVDTATGENFWISQSNLNKGSITVDGKKFIAKVDNGLGGVTQFLIADIATGNRNYIQFKSHLLHINGDFAYVVEKKSNVEYIKKVTMPHGAEYPDFVLQKFHGTFMSKLTLITPQLFVGTRMNSEAPLAIYTEDFSKPLFNFNNTYKNSISEVKFLEGSQLILVKYMVDKESYYDVWKPAL